MNKKGFTISELIIVIGIITLLFGISFRTYYNQRDSLEYQNNITKILSLVNQARTDASTSKAVYIGSQNIIPKEGFGIYIERNTTTPSKVILFANVSAADTNAATSFDSGDIIEEQMELANNTIFKNIVITNPDPADFIPTRAVILFKPPLAETYIKVFDTKSPTPTIQEPTDLTLIFSRAGKLDLEDKLNLNKAAGFMELSEK